MPDWTDTLNLRQAGKLEGFLAVDIPLEDQAEQGTTSEGPINVERTATDEDALDAMTKAELLEEAANRGIVIEDVKATKADILDALRAG
jgi:hypothetical protein